MALLVSLYTGYLCYFINMARNDVLVSFLEHESLIYKLKLLNDFMTAVTGHDASMMLSKLSDNSFQMLLKSVVKNIWSLLKIATMT